MRHGKKINHLGRTAEHRKAMLSNMAISLITHKRIETTLAKAKSLRRFIEPLVTKAKNNTTHSRRVVFSYLQNKEAINELFGPVAGAVGDRPGGYVRIIRTGFRRGDGAEMALIELVDFNPDYSGQAKPESTRGKRRRTRRGGKAVATAAATTAAVAEPEVTEEATEEVTASADAETEETETTAETAAGDVADEQVVDAGSEEE